MLKNSIHTDISEADLVAALKARNREAMGVLYDRYSRALYGIAFRVVRSEKETEDVLQDAFVRIWEQIDRFDQKRGTLYTWMHTVVRNLSLDMVKSKGYRSSQENQNLTNLVDTLEAREQELSTTLRLLDVKESVSSLEPELVEIVDTLYFQGFTQSEAAKELNLPVGTVKTRARRALNHLRNKFGKSA